jgi:hypothetical protein
MNGDRCRATLTLHDPLRRSFGTWLGGEEVASEQRCTLKGGHPGEHLGAAAPTGRGCWFRWDDSGFHLVDVAGRRHRQRREAAEPARNGRWADQSAAVSASSRGRPRRQRRREGRHAADTSSSVPSPESESTTQALWALTAAVERLADLIAATMRLDEGEHARPLSGFRINSASDR